MCLRKTAVPSHKWILLACQVVTTQVSGFRALHLHRNKYFVNRLNEDSTVNLSELCKPWDAETTFDLSMSSPPVDLWEKLRNKSLSACLLMSVSIRVHGRIHVAYRKELHRMLFSFVMSNATWIIYDQREFFSHIAYETILNSLSPHQLSDNAKNSFKSWKVERKVLQLKFISFQLFTEQEENKTQEKKFNSNWLTFILECNVIIEHIIVTLPPFAHFFCGEL